MAANYGPFTDLPAFNNPNYGQPQDPRFPGMSTYQGKSILDPYNGMPMYPNYNPAYDPNTMAVSPYVQQQLAGVNLDNTALNEFQKEAMRTGPSTWAGLASQQSRMEEAGARDTARSGAASSGAKAMADLEMQGGANSGARERVSRGAMNNYLDQSQNISRQGMLNRGQISINDEQNRVQQLGMLPGMQLNAANFGLQKAGTQINARESDIRNQIAENQNLNQFNLQRYNTQGQIWGAGKQADATAQAGGGSWLCTEAGNLNNRFDRRMLRELRKYALKKEAKIAKFYLHDCKELVVRMREIGADWAENRRFVNDVVSLVAQGKLEDALHVYKDHVVNLLLEYWPDCFHPVFVALKEEKLRKRKEFVA